MRYLREPFEVIAGNVRFRRRRLEVHELVKFLIEHLPYAFGHLERRRALLEFLDELFLAVRLHPKLLLDALELLHEVVLPLSLRNLAIDVPRKLALQLGVDKLLLENEKRLPQPILNLQALKDVLQLVHFSRRDRRGEVRKLVRLVKDVRCHLVNREVGNLIAEERIQLGDVLEYRDDLRHERANVLVILIVRLRREILHVHDRDCVVLQEGGLYRCWSCGRVRHDSGRYEQTASTYLVRLVLAVVSVTTPPQIPPSLHLLSPAR